MNFEIGVIVFFGFLVVSLFFLWFKVYQLYKIESIHAKQLDDFLGIAKSLMEASHLQTVALAALQAEIIQLKQAAGQVANERK